MENVSKTLVIAGTVLLSVLILSVLVYVFLTYSQYSYEYDQKKATEQLVQSNTKFTKYSGQTLTAQDIVTIANLTREYNSKNPENIITVYFLNSTAKLLEYFDRTNYETFLADSNNNSNNKKYKIRDDNGITYRQDGTIDSIYIIEQR